MTISRRKMLKLGFGTVAAAVAGIDFFRDQEKIITAEYDVASPRWKLPATRIGVISDLHTGGTNVPLDRVDEVVDRMNAEKCDIVLIPGDTMVDVAQTKYMPHAKRVEPALIAARLMRLNAPFRYATLGNHDWFWEHTNRGTVRDLLASFRSVGIPMLENRAERISLPGGDCFIVGIGDCGSHHANSVAAFAGLPPDASVISLTHNPALFGKMKIQDPSALMVAGHTHGGQMKLGNRHLPLHDVPDAYLHGLVERGARRMVVGAGIGDSHICARLNVPRELPVINLAAAPG